jgi:hypothetical protein
MLGCSSMLHTRQQAPGLPGEPACHKGCMGQPYDKPYKQAEDWGDEIMTGCPAVRSASQLAATCCCSSWYHLLCQPLHDDN